MLTLNRAVTCWWHYWIFYGLNSTFLFLIVVWKTLGQRVDFIKHEALLHGSIACLSYHYEKQKCRIKSLYLYFKNFPFLLWNIRFNSEQTPAHTSRGQFHGRMKIKTFLMFIVAENNVSVNIGFWWRQKKGCTNWSKQFYTTCYLWKQCCCLIVDTLLFNQNLSKNIINI